MIPRLILASSSPRRKKILSFLGISFRVVAPRGVVEERKPRESPRKLVQRLALEKATSLRRFYPNTWILGADTLVVQRGRVYGKPRGIKEAERTLSLLSGKSHQVLTGLALWGPNGQVWTGVGRSRIHFRQLTQAELKKYISTREPYDKAGGYDIRGTAGGWIRELEGDYFNVMGLPVNLLLTALDTLGFRQKPRHR
ncbi:MAG: Maf family protein [bacterium]